MRLRRTHLGSLLGGLAMLSSLSSGTASAAGVTGLPVVVRPSDANGVLLDGPGYFEVRATPGSLTHLYALVGNRSQRKATVSIVPVDAATGVYGGVTAQLASQPRRGVGTWIHLDSGRVALGPGQGTVVAFTLHVPKHTAPGQYVGAVTAFVPAHETRRGRGFAFTVQTRLADDVVVTVPGRQSQGFRPIGVSTQRRTAGIYVLAHVKNVGTLLLKGWGYLWVWQPGRKKPILSTGLSLDTSLPHTAINYPIKLGVRLPKGRYGFQLKVWWRGGHKLRHGSFTVS